MAHHGLSAGLVILVIAGNAAGQVFLMDVAVGPTYFPVAAAAGDLDQDSFGDVLVGASHPNMPQWTVRAVSGKSGQTLFTWTGTIGTSGYEVHAVAAGDSDRDGYPDVLIGNLSANGGRGEALVYSGRDGRLLRAYAGNNGGIGAADFDLDGYSDVITSDYAWLSQTQEWQVAVAYSGRTGGVLYRVVSPMGAAWLGPVERSLVVLGDVDGDGVADLAAGGPQTQNAYVFSGATGLPIYPVSGFGPPVGGFPGIANAGDVDGDGRGDFAVYTGVFSNPGQVLVYSGRSGALRHVLTGSSSYFGNTLDGAGDVDGDGYDDIVVGDSTHAGFQGAGYLFSGRSGQLMLKLDPPPFSQQFGRWVAGLGDVDSDGTDDFACVSANNIAHVFSFSDQVTVFDSLSGNRTGFEGLVRQRLGLLELTGRPMVDGSGALLPLVSLDRRHRAYDLTGQSIPQFDDVFATVMPRGGKLTFIGHGGEGAIEVDGAFVQGFGTGTGNTCTAAGTAQLDGSGAKTDLDVTMVVCQAGADGRLATVSVANTLINEVASTGGSVRTMTASRDLVIVNMHKSYVPLVALTPAQIAAADAVVSAFAPIGIPFRDEYRQFQSALDGAVGGPNRVTATIRYFSMVGGTRVERITDADYGTSTCRGCGLLTIDAQPNPVSAGQTTFLTTQNGYAGSPGVMLATRVQGVGIAPLVIAVGVFGGGATWRVPLPVPQGVFGSVDFQTVSVDGSWSNLLLSDDVRVLVR